MKLKLKGAVIDSITLHIPAKEESTGEGVSIVISLKKKKEKGTVPQALLQRINSCNTLPELMQLLFTTTQKTEAILQAFDAKIDALERQGQSLSTHPLKHNNNGSITPTTAA